jgi:hypothetical protein
MKKVVYYTPSLLSPLDLISMGESSKDGISKIGKFDSGLKYAIAILMRNKINIEIIVNSSGNILNKFIFKTSKISCQFTNKEKTLITIMDEYNDKVYETGFSIYLGKYWENWMAIRELHSNMLDEEGSFELLDENENLENQKNGTQIILHLNEEYEEVFSNLDRFFIDPNKFTKIDDNVSIINSPDKKLRIFKQGIQVYEDLDKESYYNFNVNSSTLDEMRVLNNKWSIEYQISEAIIMADLDIFKTICYTKLDDKDFLNTINCIDWIILSSEKIDFINSYYQETESLNIPNFLKTICLKDNRLNIGSKRLSTIKESISYYSSNTVVDTKNCNENISIKSKISSKYKLDLSEINILETNMTNNTVCVCDRHSNCIYINKELFKLEEHMPNFIIQYFDLKSKENIINTLAKELEKCLRNE